MIKHIIQSSLSNKIRYAIIAGISRYKYKYKIDSLQHESVLVEEILGALGDSIEDMLDIVKQGFTK